LTGWLLSNSFIFGGVAAGGWIGGDDAPLSVQVRGYTIQLTARREMEQQRPRSGHALAHPQA